MHAAVGHVVTAVVRAQTLLGLGLHRSYSWCLRVIKGRLTDQLGLLVMVQLLDREACLLRILNHLAIRFALNF